MRCVALRLFVLLIGFGLGAGSAQAQSPLPLGSALPAADTALQTTDGTQVRLGDLVGSAATVVVFASNQCPWFDKAEDRLLALADEYAAQGVNFVFINSNDPDAFPKENQQASAARATDYPFPYGLDPTGAVARAFGAERTPHVFAFDANSSLAYVGTLDDSPGDPANVQSAYLADALGALVGGGGVAVPQTKSYGCLLRLRNQ